MVSQNKSISMVLVFDRLRELTDELVQARAMVESITEDRNRIIVELKSARVPDRALMRLTGLSRQQVHRIMAAPHQSNETLRIAEMVAGPR